MNAWPWAFALAMNVLPWAPHITSAQVQPHAVTRLSRVIDALAPCGAEGGEIAPVTCIVEKVSCGYGLGIGRMHAQRLQIHSYVADVTGEIARATSTRDSARSAFALL